jgi:hypothetical protein
MAGRKAEYEASQVLINDDEGTESNARTKTKWIYIAAACLIFAVTGSIIAFNMFKKADDKPAIETGTSNVQENPGQTSDRLQIYKSKLEEAAKNASIKDDAFSDFNAYFEKLTGKNVSPELKAQLETEYIMAAIPKTEAAAFDFLYSAHFIKADNIFRKPHYMASATILQKEMFRLKSKYMSKEVFDHYNTEEYILDKRFIIASMPAIVKDLVDHKDEIPDFYKEAAVRYYFAYYELSESFGQDDAVKYEKYSAYDENLSIFLYIVESEYLNKETRLPFMKGEPYISLFE